MNPEVIKLQSKVIKENVRLKARLKSPIDTSGIKATLRIDPERPDTRVRGGESALPTLDQLNPQIPCS